MADELIGRCRWRAAEPEAGRTRGPQPSGPWRDARAAGGRWRPRQPAPALPTEQPKKDVVEILRGDRFEQRNFAKGDGR